MPDKKYENNAIKEIITQHLTSKTFAEIDVDLFAPDGKWASQIAKYLGKEMKVNQLRKVFSELKNIELVLKRQGKKDSDDFNDPRLSLLIPQLAYAKARKLIREDFYELMKVVIGDKKTTKIKKVGDYRRFVEFMTAIVAYHKQDYN